MEDRKWLFSINHEFSLLQFPSRTFTSRLATTFFLMNHSLRTTSLFTMEFDSMSKSDKEQYLLSRKDFLHEELFSLALKGKTRIESENAKQLNAELEIIDEALKHSLAMQQVLQFHSHIDTLGSGLENSPLKQTCPRSDDHFISTRNPAAELLTRNLITSLPYFNRQSIDFNVSMFLQSFETQLSAAEIPTNQWPTFLIQRVPSNDTTTLNWMANNVLKK